MKFNIIKNKLAYLLSFLIISLVYNYGRSNKNEPNPNIVLIFLDDSGYSDFEPFAKTEYATPNVERLAKEGRSFTNFYVPQAVCSASRAALLTGCYPGRTKVFGAHAPKEEGLNPKFNTLGELLQNAGYKTASFGKWHIGDQPATHPYNRGFDESCGLMYSNDMWANHPVDPEYWGKYPLQFWENGKVTIDSIKADDQKMLTTWYTEHAVDFIDKNKNNPFFLYLPHSMPHVPIFCSDKFEGKSGKGLYADVLLEIDWSVGEIMDCLKKNGLEENTIVIFTSDNGPWAIYGNHSGKTPYRESKATSFDGGTKSSLIIKYPGNIEANTKSKNVFTSIDLLPTIIGLTNAKLPGYEIDGVDVWDMISGDTNVTNPHEYYAFSANDNFEAVMSSDGKWKLHLPHEYRSLSEVGNDGIPGSFEIKKIELSLFDLENDPYEQKNVIAEYPKVVKKLLEYSERHRQKFYSIDNSDE